MLCEFLHVRGWKTILSSIIRKVSSSFLLDDNELIVCQ